MATYRERLAGNPPAGVGKGGKQEMHSQRPVVCNLGHTGMTPDIVFITTKAGIHHDEGEATTKAGGAPMNWAQPSRKQSDGRLKLVGRIYDTAQTALFASLVAFVAFFGVFILPDMPRLQADMETEQLLALHAENNAYCEKWGFARGTRKHAACILDLQELRAKIDQRASDQLFP